MTHFEVLESELRKFEIDLPAPQKLALSQYCDELNRWNKKMNLTGLSGAEMVRRLVVEPVWIGLQLGLSGVLVDVGSGNGSPAIPLAVVSRFANAHLVEARTKRAAFLRHVSSLLKLPGLTVHRGRFEEIAPALEKADWVTLQAMALTDQIIDSMSLISCTTTTVVWITSGAPRTTLRSFRTFEVPLTNSKVFLFRLDQS